MKRNRTETGSGMVAALTCGALAVSTGLLMLCTAVTAAADDPQADDGERFNRRIYGGIGIVGSRLDPDTDAVSQSVDRRQGVGGSLTLGYDLLPRLSLEGHFADLGEADLRPDGGVDYRVGGIDVLLYGLNDAGQRWLRQGFSLFGRLGVGAIEVDSDLPIERVNQYSLLTGLGVEYGFDNGVGVRAELVSHDTDARYAQVGMIYRFGSAGIPLASASRDGSSIDDRRNASAADQAEAAQQPEARQPVDADADGVPDVRDDCPASSADMPVDETGCDALDNASDLVGFAFDSTRLSDEAKATLDAVIAVMLETPDARIVIDAHTDNVGSAVDNLRLSAGRAVAVARYLVDNEIDGDRLQPRAFGESQPRASNATMEGRATNRRVEFRLQ